MSATRVRILPSTLTSSHGDGCAVMCRPQTEVVRVFLSGLPGLRVHSCLSWLSTSARHDCELRGLRLCAGCSAVWTGHRNRSAIRAESVTAAVLCGFSVAEGAVFQCLRDVMPTGRRQQLPMLVLDALAWHELLANSRCSSIGALLFCRPLILTNLRRFIQVLKTRPSRWKLNLSPLSPLLSS